MVVIEEFNNFEEILTVMVRHKLYLN